MHFGEFGSVKISTVYILVLMVQEFIEKHVWFYIYEPLNSVKNRSLTMDYSLCILASLGLSRFRQFIYQFYVVGCTESNGTRAG